MSEDRAKIEEQLEAAFDALNKSRIDRERAVEKETEEIARRLKEEGAYVSLERQEDRRAKMLGRLVGGIMFTLGAAIGLWYLRPATDSASLMRAALPTVQTEAGDLAALRSALASVDSQLAIYDAKFKALGGKTGVRVRFLGLA